MFEELRVLVELQAKDTHLLAVEKMLNEIPLQIKKLEEELAAEEIIVKNQRQSISAMEKEQRKAELDMKTAEELSARLQNQLFACKNNKEYEAVQHEIAASKEKISAMEEKILTLMDELESARMLLTEEEKVFADKKNVNGAKLVQLEAIGREKGLERNNFHTSREEIASKLNPLTREQYDKISKARKHLAVVGISKTICKGCYNELPPQMINEVMQNSCIYNCQACGRILYWEESCLAGNSTK